MAKNSNILVNMSEIAAYAQRPANTIKAWIRDQNFPAAKIDGRWESNTNLIENFQRRRIENMIVSGAEPEEYPGTRGHPSTYSEARWKFKPLRS